MTITLHALSSARGLAALIVLLYTIARIIIRPRLKKHPRIFRALCILPLVGIPIHYWLNFYHGANGMSKTLDIFMLLYIEALIPVLLVFTVIRKTEKESKKHRRIRKSLVVTIVPLVILSSLIVFGTYVVSFVARSYESNYSKYG